MIASPMTDSGKIRRTTMRQHIMERGIPDKPNVEPTLELPPSFAYLVVNPTSPDPTLNIPPVFSYLVLNPTSPDPTWNTPLISC